MNKNPRLIDIARLASVSIGTVDRVIHNRGRVASKTKEKILKISEDLGYKPNIHASGLASTKTSKKLLVLIPNKGQDPYWDSVHEGCQIAKVKMSHQNIHLQFKCFDLFDRTDFLKMINQLDFTGVDGILLSPIFRKESEKVFSKLDEIQKPFVIINTKIEWKSEYLISYVGPNSYQSGRLAARLMSLHCSENDNVLIFPLDKEFKNAQHYLEKEKGFREWFEEMMPSVKVVTREFENFDNIYELNKFLKFQLSEIGNLAGIFTGSSRIHKIAEYLEENQINNIRLIGYDSIEANLHYLKKGKIDYLIGQNPKLMGCVGLLNLRDQIVFRLKPKAVQYLPLDVLLPENVSFNSGNYYLPEVQEAFLQ